MPILMHMRWEGVTAEQYDSLRQEVNLEANPPEGGVFHAAAFDANGARITDVWETADHFNRFVATRLMPAVGKLGIPGQPRVEILSAHAVYWPPRG